LSLLLRHDAMRADEVERQALGDDEVRREVEPADLGAVNVSAEGADDVFDMPSTAGSSPIVQSRIGAEGGVDVGRLLGIVLGGDEEVQLLELEMESIPGRLAPGIDVHGPEIMMVPDCSVIAAER
jgi:hypothetical protein